MSIRLPTPEPSSPATGWWSTCLDPVNRLMLSMVLMRVLFGLYLFQSGYQQWDNPLLVADLTSQWLEWTRHTPVFWLADVFHVLIIPNASFFAPAFADSQMVAGACVTLGFFHTWAIRVVALWMGVHLLLIHHLHMPGHNMLLLTMCLICIVLWLADAGVWFGLDYWMLPWLSRFRPLRETGSADVSPSEDTHKETVPNLADPLSPHGS